MNIVTCKPIKDGVHPKYPSKLETEAIPAMLEHHMPSSWNLRPELVSAAALFLGLGIGGCKELSNRGTQSGKSENSASKPIVAPVFRHGEGWGREPHYYLLGGTSGRIATRYMTEEEAKQIILIKLNKLGWSPTEHNVPLYDVQVPVLQVIQKKKWTPDSGETHSWKVEAQPLPLKADIVDKEKRIFIEIITGDDFYCFPVPDPPEPSYPDEFIEPFDLYYRCFPDIGEKLCHIVRTECTDDIYFGVLYDPVVNRGKKNGPSIEKQVKDLVDWLKAQGAI